LLTGQWWASLQDVVAALQIISYNFGLTGYRITKVADLNLLKRYWPLKKTVKIITKIQKL
jgi:hypothetical protein